jgi:hypothetical protein
MGQLATHRFLHNIVHNWQSSPHLTYARWRVRWVVIPMVNPWGVSQATRTRQNANGVDLNRNWNYKWADFTTGAGAPFGYDYKGTAPFSEVESQLFRDLVVVSYPGTHAVIDAHSHVGGTGAEPRYDMYLPVYDETNARRAFGALGKRLLRGTETASIGAPGGTPTPSGYNYFASLGFNSSNPEWDSLVPNYGSEDMTAAVRWYGNVYLAYAFAEPAKALSGPSVRTFYGTTGATIAQGASYAKVYPDFTFTPPGDGLLVLDAQIVASPTVASLVMVRPYIGQDGSVFTASILTFNKQEDYENVGAGENREIVLKAVLPVRAGGMVRFNIEGKSDNSAAAVKRFFATLLFLPSDHRLLEMFRYESADPTRWYVQYPNRESSP